MSGEQADTMPEYFLTSSIFRDIGKIRAVTLETPCWQIYRWIESSQVDRPNHSEAALKVDAAWKVDMIIYDGKEKHPNDQVIWGLAEFKNGYVDADTLPGRRSDRDKLMTIREKFKSGPPFLICCGAIHCEERREYHRRMADKNNDIWFEESVTGLSSDCAPHFFCARVLR